jgi:hypothetical protein
MPITDGDDAVAPVPVPAEGRVAGFGDPRGTLWHAATSRQAADRRSVRTNQVLGRVLNTGQIVPSIDPFPSRRKGHLPGIATPTTGSAAGMPIAKARGEGAVQVSHLYYNGIVLAVNSPLE